MPQKILVLHSAPVKRVEHGIEDLRTRGLFDDPEITVFSRRDDRAEKRFRANAAVGRVGVRRAGWNPLPDIRRLRSERLDTVVVFFTGERGYWKMKWMAPWLGAERILVYAGDGEMFALGAATYVRFLLMRARKRRPDDFAAYQDGPAQPWSDRVLVLQTAPPELVAEGIRRLRAQAIFRDPQITLLMRKISAPHPIWNTLKPAPEMQTHNGVRGAWAELRARRAERYDGLALFLSGDPSFRKMKVFAFLCGARRVLIFNENLDCFFYSHGAFVRFLERRLRYGVERTAVSAQGSSGPPLERVLVLQSAEPEIVEPALALIHERKIFRNPHITLFARGGERYRMAFAGNPHIQSLLIHKHMDKAWSHLQMFRREQYDAAVLFLTGDPSYWKIKYFAFLCGARQLLVFNEHLDCFFYTPRALAGFLWERWRQRASHPDGAYTIGPRAALIKLLRPAVYPFRFAYLLFYYWKLQRRRPQ